MNYKNILFTINFFVGFYLACTPFSEPNFNSCAQQDGDATCKKMFGDARPYCIMCGEGSNYNEGCVEDEPTDLGCYSPCGGMQSFEENSSCISVGETGGDETSDGDGDTGPMCMDSSECTPEMPLCEAGDCIVCGDGVETSCAVDYPDTPICDMNGQCVECTDEDVSACPAEMPTCEANVCVPCTQHEQCPDSACNMDAGNCIDQTNILHVDGSPGVDCGMGNGSETLPYCTLGEALSQSSGEALIYVHATSDGSGYQEGLIINDENTMIVVSGVLDKGGNRPVLLGINSSIGLTVGPLGKLSLSNVEISKSDKEGLLVNGKVWIEKSLVIDNDGGGIVVDGGVLIVENSFIGGDKDNVFSLDVLSGSATMTYVTLAAGYGTAVALHCHNATTIIVRNSLLVAQTEIPELDCIDAQVSDSALEQMVPGNVQLGSMSMDWFANYGGQDFHLSGLQPEILSTAAIWTTGDPATDIDGDDRPMIDGSSDFAGADVRN